MVITPVGHGLGIHWGMAAAFFTMPSWCCSIPWQPAGICEAVQREKVTAIPTVPALIARVVQMDDLAKYDLSSLKKISVGGAPEHAGAGQDRLRKDRLPVHQRIRLCRRHVRQHETG